MHKLLLLGIVISSAHFVTQVRADDKSLAADLATVRSVGPKGQNHPAAAAAAKRLQQAGSGQLEQVLLAMDDANPLALNWLRGIAEAIAQKHQQTGGELPLAILEKFFRDTQHGPRARRLAYELIAKQDPRVEERLIAGLQTDPSLELRYDAIRLAIDQAAKLEKEGDKAAAIKQYSQAFTNARDIKQIKLLAETLKKLGGPVNMPKKMGFIINWHVIGPFENGGDMGWDIAYTPETKIDFTAETIGKSGPVKWVPYATTDEFGIADLNQALAKHKGAIAYAAAQFVSPKDQAVEIRTGCINAHKVWVNGELVMANRVYHTGIEIDQYRGEAKLKAGANMILVKIGQNEMTEPWAQDWKFQLRVCDPLGGAILPAN